MKRLMLFLLLIISIYLVQGAGDYEVCDINGGVKLCETYYCCGDNDGICPEYWGASCSSSPDPDCPESGCKPDCTNAEGECSSLCDGEGGCEIPDEYFVDEEYLCELRIPGVLVPFNETHELECCIRGPSEQIDVTFTNVEDFDKTLVKYTKIVNYKGKPVKMVMVVWG